MIESEWPERMEVNHGRSIRVSLIKVAGQGFVTSVEAEGRSVRLDTPGPVGTQDASLEAAYGPECIASAIARIGASTFECDLSSQEIQKLDETRLDWMWNCSSDNVGHHDIDFSLSVRWEFADGRITERQIWDNQVSVEVYEPWITKGQLSISSLISGFLGTALNASWLYDRYKEARKKPPEDDKPEIVIARR